MSEAKERYYKYLHETKEIYKEGIRDEITDYVDECEIKISVLKKNNKNLLKTIKEIKKLSESFPCGYYEPEEFNEKDESPEDAILHTISVIRNRCIKFLENNN